MEEIQPKDYLQSPWSPHGLYTESSRTPHGLLMESMETQCGLHMSPHGVHGNVWVSVKGSECGVVDCVMFGVSPSSTYNNITLHALFLFCYCKWEGVCPYGLKNYFKSCGQSHG